MFLVLLTIFATTNVVAQMTTPAPTPTPCRTIFSTNNGVDGNLGAGGIEAVDAYCTSQATNFGTAQMQARVGILDEYKAWLSNSTVDAVSRFNFVSTTCFQTPDGTQIASSLADFLDGSLSLPPTGIQRANGAAPTQSVIYTGIAKCVS